MVKKIVMEKYQQALKLLDLYKKLPTKGVYMDGFFTDPGFYRERTKSLLKALGLVGDELAIIHVTGTSGKGSVSAGLAAQLELAGKKVGLFTSPPVQVQTERFVINSKYISVSDYYYYLEKTLQAAESLANNTMGRPSVGEVNVAIVYQYFIDKGVEVAVIEALAGGRYDATNALENKLLTVVTRIGLDHMHLLGDSVEKIAVDKAFIARAGVPLICGESNHLVRDLIQTVCNHVGAKFIPVVESDSNLNHGLIATACQVLGINHQPKDIQLPARLERQEYKGWLVLLDGAHNAQKMNYLMDYISTLKFKKLHLLLAASSNKNSKQYLEQVMQAADSVTLTSFPLLNFEKHTAKLSMRSVTELSDIADSVNVQYSVVPNPTEAFKDIAAKAGVDDLILVTGSMYLCGRIRELFYTADQILAQRTSFPTYL